MGLVLGAGAGSGARRGLATALNRRRRQHVNPLTAAHRAATPAPSTDAWRAAFPHGLDRPLHLDIGSHKGTVPGDRRRVMLPPPLTGTRSPLPCGAHRAGAFLHRLAAALPHYNHLGVEVRAPFVETALAHRPPAVADRVHFLVGNAYAEAIDRLFAHWPLAEVGPPLASVSILFPDPWLKARHHKRRVATAALAAALARWARPDAVLLFKSDVAEVAQAATDELGQPASGWAPLLPLTAAAPLHAADLAAAATLPPDVRTLLSVASERERVSPAMWVSVHHRRTP